MNREQKAQLVEEVRGRFSAAPLVILADYKGSTVLEMDAMRRACEPLGIHFQVLKNTLCKRAVVGTDKESLTDQFRGPVAVLFSGEDPVAAAKLFKDQQKGNKSLDLKAGFFEGDLLDAKGVEVVSELPSKEELQVIFLRTLQEAPRQVLGVVQGPARDLVYVLNNYAGTLAE
jgi:large subunit ribosomal protein L10